MVLSWSCGDPDEEGSSPTAGAAHGEGLLAEGCPVPGRALARRITSPGGGAEGPAALGQPGDHLLLNEAAAFVIAGPGRGPGYSGAGGIPLDAVALAGCRQAGPERFDELVFLVARVEPGAPDQVQLRGIRAETVEIVADGAAGGPAHLRVRGVDETFEYLETKLLKAAYLQGQPRARSEPLSLEITLEYLLFPGEPLLTVELTLRNRGSVEQRVSSGAAVFFSPTTEANHLARARTTVAGFTLDVGVPWLAAQSPEGDGAWAVSRPGFLPAALRHSVLYGLLDLGELLAPPRLVPRAAGAGEPESEGEVYRATYHLAVGGGDSNSATRVLFALHPDAVDGVVRTSRALRGRVLRRDDGRPVAGVRLQVERAEGQTPGGPLERLISDARGNFQGLIPDLGVPLRLVALPEGQPAPEPLLFSCVSRPAVGIPGKVPEAGCRPLAAIRGNLSLEEEAELELKVLLDPEAWLTWSILDQHGRPLPARITLWQQGRKVRELRGDGQPGRRALPPGTYQATVTRGFEYSVHRQQLVLHPGQETHLEARLTRVVDTRGFLALDAHLHSHASPDGRVTARERVLAAAAEGLEVVVATDHEHVGSWQAEVEQAGLQRWLVSLAGEEVTAELPEHLNLYPLLPRPELPRGGPLDWAGLDLAQLIRAGRQRGAAIVQLNHPRGGCGYLCLAGYDRRTGRPTLDDPTLLGFSPEAELWSFEFDAFEYMNGAQAVWLRPEAPEETGLLDDWLSFLNHGHPVTALGNSDAHGYELGCPRSYFASPTDEPSAFREEDLVRAIREGRVLVSTGAFARVELDGAAGPGELLSAGGRGQVELSLHIEALPEVEVSWFQVLVNCDEVLSQVTTAPGGRVKFHGVLQVPLERDAHLVVLGFGDSPLPPELYPGFSADIPRFTTNAVYIDADGDGLFSPPGGKPCTYVPRGPQHRQVRSLRPLPSGPGLSGSRQAGRP